MANRRARLLPIVLVYLIRWSGRSAPGWFLTAMSYVLMIALVCADLLLDASTAFR